jgi:hypothetical protein
MAVELRGLLLPATIGREAVHAFACESIFRHPQNKLWVAAIYEQGDEISTEYEIQLRDVLWLPFLLCTAPLLNNANKFPSFDSLFGPQLALPNGALCPVPRYPQPVLIALIWRHGRSFEGWFHSRRKRYPS